MIGLGQGMTYYRKTGQVEYRSKDGTETKLFDALEWPRRRADANTRGHVQSRTQQGRVVRPGGSRQADGSIKITQNQDHH